MEQNADTVREPSACSHCRLFNFTIMLGGAATRIGHRAQLSM